MTKLNRKLLQWWEWYSQPLSLSRAASEWNWIERIALETRSDHPVLSVQVESENRTIAGYCVLAAGGLAIHGGITQRLRCSNQRNSHFNISLQQGQAKTICVEKLIVESFNMKAELYQALLPIEYQIRERSVDQGPLQEDFSAAGMNYLTRLVRMETALPPNRPIEPRPHKNDQLQLDPYESIAPKDWIEQLEKTYVDSDDVPELASMRTTEKAIQGYQANRTEGVQGWFVIRCNGKPAGCLILARHYYPIGEISYLGLVPEFRGLGYSFGIMRFAMNWMAAQRCSKVVLAVDCRNEVAMNVYQKWGFQATISYHAWVASPKTFTPTFCH